MSGTLTTPVAYIDDLGIHAPTYDQVLTYFKSGMQTIYGEDVYLENDSQDGQLLALFSKAVHDCNSLAVAVYNGYSPVTAQGPGLSTGVKLIGLRRNVASNSTADIQVSGNVGTVISNGIVSDGINKWLLPASVTIGNDGTATVTATCQALGAIVANANTINQIATPTRGWISATNLQAAAVGEPVETDGALRQRQSVSAAMPSTSTYEGLYAALIALTGVQRVKIYENLTAVNDTVNGVNANSIGVVVEGGDVVAIATTIMNKKGQGAGTTGTTLEPVTDIYGISHPISFFRPVEIGVIVTVNVKALPGYNTNIGTALQAAIVAAAQDPLNGSNAIGSTVHLHRFYAYAFLDQSAGGRTYDVTSIVLFAPGVSVDGAGNLLFTGANAPFYSAAAVILNVT